MTALMPESWLKAAMAMASRMTFRLRATKKGAVPSELSSRIARWMSASSDSASSCDRVSRAMISRASWSRLCPRSQRGLSGMNRASTMKMTAGTASTPNIQRHATE